MQGFWIQVVALGVIIQFALPTVSGKALLQQNEETQQQTDQRVEATDVAQKRIGYDSVTPYIGDDGHHDDHHDHHEHHDPGYWKKKLIWKEGWKKIWKKSKKQIWNQKWIKVWKPEWKSISVPAWKEIWVPGVKKIWRPVWISEWFPSPDHHEHVHDHHGWDDRSDNNVAASQKSAAVVPAPQQQPPKQSEQSTWQFPK